MKNRNLRLKPKQKSRSRDLLTRTSRHLTLPQAPIQPTREITRIKAPKMMAPMATVSPACCRLSLSPSLKAFLTSSQPSLNRMPRTRTARPKIWRDTEFS